MLVSCNVYSIGFDFAAKDCFSGRKERSSKSNPKSTSTKDFSNVSKTFHQQIGKEKTFSFFFWGESKEFDVAHYEREMGKVGALFVWGLCEDFVTVECFQVV